MARAGMQLLQDQFVLDPTADLQFADVVADDELEALGVTVHLATGIVDQIDPLLERHLEMMTDPLDRLALLEVIGVDADLQQTIH